jgi:hypothetical protein
MRGDICALIVVLVLGALALICLAHSQRQQPPHRGAATLERLLKPRTPDDCPACRRQRALPAAVQAPVAPVAPVRPWREVKSRRGAPKRIATDGFACPNPACAYYRITDATIHALVGDGMHGRVERIQTFRCQACQTTFTSRRDTPLYRLKTAATRVAEVLSALAEGLSVAAAVRVFGHRAGTIATWLTRAGEHSADAARPLVPAPPSPARPVGRTAHAPPQRAQVLWLWVAIDPRTKLIPVLHLGARTQTAAHAVVHELRQRLAPSCLPVFTSDGLNLYFYALTATSVSGSRWSVGEPASGRCARPDLRAGQEDVPRRKVVRVRHVMRCGTAEDLRGALVNLGLSGG